MGIQSLLDCTGVFLRQVQRRTARQSHVDQASELKCHDSPFSFWLLSPLGAFQPRKAQKADPRNKASQTFCGTFSGTKVNPWNHPQILRPAGVRNLDLSAPKNSKSGPPQVDKQPAPRTQTSASALTGRGCQCAVLNVLLFQPPLRTLPQSLLGQERISGHVRPWLAPPPPPILLSSHLPEDCI